MSTSPQRAQNISFYLLLALVGLIVVFMFLPFFKLIALGGILAVLFHPLKLKLDKHFKSQTITSLITLIVAAVVIMLPVYAVGQLAFNEIANVYSQQATQGSLTSSLNNFVAHLNGSAHAVAQNLLDTAAQKIAGFAGNAFQSITALLGNIAGFFISLVLVVLTLYYFLRDGGKFRAFVEGVFPLSHSHETLLVEKLESAVKGVVQGAFTVALLQGSVATVGFVIFGVPQPLLWGIFAVLSSLVPTVGTLLATGPAIVYLFLSGHTGAGIGLAIWAFISIQALDNFVSPKLIGNKTKLHPLLTLLSIIGGLRLFGPLGFLMGPILMAMFMALVEIYNLDLRL